MSVHSLREAAMAGVDLVDELLSEAGAKGKVIVLVELDDDSPRLEDGNDAGTGMLAQQDITPRDLFDELLTHAQMLAHSEGIEFEVIYPELN